MSPVSPDTYYVWRRSDGYVGCTVGPPQGRDTFDVLLITDDWPSARDHIEANRDEAHRAALESQT